MTTMEKVYQDAQAACGLKVGDRVKVLRKADHHEAGWGADWCEWKTKLMGRIGVITAIYSDSIEVTFIIGGDNNTCSLPYFVLEKVEKPQHEFKPFDRVLVRDDDTHEWRPNIFLFMDDSDREKYACINCMWAQCIPYEGNEHLAGTTDMPEE